MAAAAAIPGALSSQYGSSRTATLFESASTHKVWQVPTQNIFLYSQPLARLASSNAFRGRVIIIVGFEDRTINDLAVHMRGEEFNHQAYNPDDLVSNDPEADTKSLYRGFANLHRLAEIFDVVALMQLADQEFQRSFAIEFQKRGLVRLILDVTNDSNYKLSQNMRQLMVRRMAAIVGEAKMEDLPNIEAIRDHHPGFNDELRVASRGNYLLDP